MASLKAETVEVEELAYLSVPLLWELLGSCLELEIASSESLEELCEESTEEEELEGEADELTPFLERSALLAN